MIGAKQAASRLGISLSLLYSLCHAGRLRHRRVGRAEGKGKYLFSEEDLNVFLATCEIEVVDGDETELKHIRQIGESQDKSKADRTFRPTRQKTIRNS